MRRIVHVSDLRVGDLVEFPVGCVGPRVWRAAAIERIDATGGDGVYAWNIGWGGSPDSGWAQPKPWGASYSSRTFVCVPLVVHRREVEQRRQKRGAGA